MTHQIWLWDTVFLLNMLVVMLIVLSAALMTPPSRRAALLPKVQWSTVTWVCKTSITPPFRFKAELPVKMLLSLIKMHSEASKQSPSQPRQNYCWKCNQWRQVYSRKHQPHHHLWKVLHFLWRYYLWHLCHYSRGEEPHHMNVPYIVDEHTITNDNLAIMNNS